MPLKVTEKGGANLKIKRKASSHNPVEGGEEENCEEPVSGSLTKRENHVQAKR